MGLYDKLVVLAIAGEVPAASVTVPEKPPILCIVTRVVEDAPCCTPMLDGFVVMLRSGVELFEILHPVRGCSSQDEYP